MSGLREEVRTRVVAKPRCRPRIVASIAIVLVLVAAGLAFFAVTKDLAGLTIGGSEPGVSPPASPSASPRVTTAPAQTAPTPVRFDPAGSDDANLQLFRGVLTKAAGSASSSSITGKVLTDALVAVGFDAAAMQRTADQTSANLEAPTLTISVRLQTSCLIGQFVRSDASVTTELTAPIETRACLIGETIPVK